MDCVDSLINRVLNIMMLALKRKLTTTKKTIHIQRLENTILG
uniref:Uncharacterized protein n=1 Tax=virus sp. ct9pU4 TaxID=2828248 RepID=A0A8S5RBJ4_9VIRU|nr:MAG TPA: hypothetical protein [virus sp. ct9pU4]DAK20357.1 MAG TPA: hypothetical protein [Bacteriophage sp.]DAW07170.1 MAG TPA: hypothetical protein [Caudoviricetes sp.]